MVLSLLLAEYVTCSSLYLCKSKCWSLSVWLGGPHVHVPRPHGTTTIIVEQEHIMKDKHNSNSFIKFLLQDDQEELRFFFPLQKHPKCQKISNKLNSFSRHTYKVPTSDNRVIVATQGGLKGGKREKICFGYHKIIGDQMRNLLN